MMTSNRKRKQESSTVTQAPADAASEADISPAVPTELLVSVLVGQLDEDVAIARGLLAVGAQSEGERRVILFGNDDRASGVTTPAMVRRPHWRPVGQPPWGEP